MANDKKTEGGKAPTKSETIHLKVFIHCEGCKKKVKRTLNGIEGVQTVDVDERLGKVTITSTMDSAVLIKKLEKAGKVAELIPNGGGGGGGKGKEQPKGDKKAANDETIGAKENEKKGANGTENNDDDTNKKPNSKNQENNKNNNNSSNNGQGGKKKKGGGGGGVEVSAEASYESGAGMGSSYESGVNTFYDSGMNKNMANKNIAPMMVETGYSTTMESAEYATHMFSDENANNCIIM